MVEPVETVEAWQCVGCGRLQAERPCIGVCTDKKIELVQAADYAALAWRVEATEGAIGFEIQKALLDAVAPWVPPSACASRR